MESKSLFGHIATKFSTHPENIATEALNFILNQSISAKKSFIEYAAKMNRKLTKDLSFQTQDSTKKMEDQIS